LLVAVALVAVSVSLKKTVLRVNENTMQTLTSANDQHTDFVRHMLDFIANQATYTTWIAFFAVLWLLVNAIVFWRCLGKPERAHEIQPTGAHQAGGNH
jgi:hypothetical protein